jgi:hypothetical protein
MGAGIWASRVAGCGLVLWLCGAAVASGDASLLVEPQEVVGGEGSDARAVTEEQVAVKAASLQHRVRPVKDGVFETASLLREAERRSSTIRRLVGALNRTDIVVYIELAPSVPNRSGRLTFIAANRAFRMFRISLDMRNHVDDQIKWLGHELAHALEVGLAPDVRSESSMKKLYARVGRRVDGGPDYETAGAEETGRLVKAEISER